MTDVATPWRRGRSFQKFLETLPDILAGQTFKAVVSAIVTARQRGKPVILGMGAHPTKVGLNPILVDLMRKDVITAVAMNGAVVIHDFELAYQGHTSEEVEAEIDSGRFGMAEDTGRILNEAIAKGWQKGLGVGEAVGRYITSHPQQFPHRRSSLLATGVQLCLPGRPEWSVSLKRLKATGGFLNPWFWMPRKSSPRSLSICWPGRNDGATEDET